MILRNLACLTAAATLLASGVLAAEPATAQPAAAQPTVAASDLPPAAPQRLPLVVMKQVKINGKVLYLADEEKDGAAASNLRIQVKTFDDQKLIHETRTDEKGRYELPNLDVGKYRLVVGLLKLELRVESPDSVTRGDERIAKTILVFLPRALADRAEDSAPKKSPESTTP